MPDNAQIVGDEENRQVHLLLQVEQQIQDLCLDRNIQRRRRLVGQQQPRIRSQSAPYSDALLLPAAQHEGKTMHMDVVQPYTLHDPPHPSIQLVPVARQVTPFIGSAMMSLTLNLEFSDD